MTVQVYPQYENYVLLLLCAIKNSHKSCQLKKLPKFSLSQHDKVAFEPHMRDLQQYRIHVLDFQLWSSQDKIPAPARYYCKSANYQTISNIFHKNFSLSIKPPNNGIDRLSNAQHTGLTSYYSYYNSSCKNSHLKRQTRKQPSNRG